MSGKADEGDAELRNRAKGEGKEEAAATPDAADDSYEFAAVAPDADLPELRVEEGQDIDYRIILIFYLLGDLGTVEPSLHVSSALCHFRLRML